MNCTYCLIIAFIGFLGWPILLPWLEAKAWRELATRTGLTYEPRSGFLGISGRGRVIGTYRGRMLRLDTFSGRPATRGTPWYMRIVVSVNNQVNGVLPLHNASSAGIESQKFWWGKPSVQVSDEFDQKFRSIVGDIQEYKIEVNGEELQFVEKMFFGYFQGADRNVQRLRSLFDTLCDVAEAVEQAGKGG